MSRKGNYISNRMAAIEGTLDNALVNPGKGNANLYSNLAFSENKKKKQNKKQIENEFINSANKKRIEDEFINTANKKLSKPHVYTGMGKAKEQGPEHLPEDYSDNRPSNVILKKKHNIESEFFKSLQQKPIVYDSKKPKPLTKITPKPPSSPKSKKMDSRKTAPPTVIKPKKPIRPASPKPKKTVIRESVPPTQIKPKKIIQMSPKMDKKKAIFENKKPVTEKPNPSETQTPELNRPSIPKKLSSSEAETPEKPSIPKKSVTEKPNPSEGRKSPEPNRKPTVLKKQLNESLSVKSEDTNEAELLPKPKTIKVISLIPGGRPSKTIEVPRPKLVEGMHFRSKSLNDETSTQYKPSDNTRISKTRSPPSKTKSPRSKSPISKTKSPRSKSPPSKTKSPRSKSPIPKTKSPRAKSPTSKTKSPPIKEALSKEIMDDFIGTLGSLAPDSPTTVVKENLPTYKPVRPTSPPKKVVSMPKFKKIERKRAEDVTRKPDECKKTDNKKVEKRETKQMKRQLSPIALAKQNAMENAWKKFEDYIFPDLTMEDILEVNEKELDGMFEEADLLFKERVVLRKEIARRRISPDGDDACSKLQQQFLDQDKAS